MSCISILIADDDFNKISSIIKAIQEQYYGVLAISQASNVQEAVENLQKKEFHLLITDFQMPLKFDTRPDNNGGLVLLNNLYRKRSNINVPMYVVGLTQFYDLQHSYKGVWKVWHYDSSSLDWKINLQSLIMHIDLVKSRIASNKIETVFIEGPTDKKIIENSIKLFFPELSNKVYLDTIQFGGGAAWVERQLFIWAKSLTKTVFNGDYIKAVGILDDDVAGDLAVNNLRKTIDIASAESKTFSIIRNSSKYSILLKSVKNKGIKLQSTLEELFSINCWRLAEKRSWLQLRHTSTIKIDETILHLKQDEITASNLLLNGFTDDEILIILYKIKEDKKQSLTNIICDMDKEIKIDMLLSMKYILTDTFNKLKLIE